MLLMITSTALLEKDSFYEMTVFQVFPYSDTKCCSCCFYWLSFVSTRNQNMAVFLWSLSDLGKNLLETLTRFTFTNTKTHTTLDSL